MTDVRLSGVSLDLFETGGGIKFTGLNVVNDGRWWILDGPQLIEDSKITSIGGGAIPGIEGAGIGPGDFVDANFHPTSGYLLATVDYEVVDASLTSTFELKVGRNVIADWHGASPMVHFNDYSQPAVPGTYPALPALTNPPPPQPQPSPPDPVRRDPAPPLNQPGIVDPPPHPEPVGADPGDVIGPIDVPPVPMPLDWRVVVITDETIQRPTLLLPPELQEAYEIWIAAERALVPVDDDRSYLNRVENMPTRVNPGDLHSSAQLVTGEGVVSGSVVCDDTILMATSSSGRSVQIPIEVWRSKINGLRVTETFHETATFADLTTDGSVNPSTSVPEPAAIILSFLVLAACGVVRRGTKHRPPAWR